VVNAQKLKLSKTRGISVAVVSHDLLVPDSEVDEEEPGGNKPPHLLCKQDPEPSRDHSEVEGEERVDERASDRFGDEQREVRSSSPPLDLFMRT